MSDFFRRPLTRVVLVVLGVLLFFRAVYALRDPLTPFAVALALAYFLNPLVNGMEEGNFITPRIVGQSLGLHAVVIMLAVLVGGSLFGFIGMLLAVPVTAALSVFWADLRNLYLRSDFFRAPAA